MFIRRADGAEIAEPEQDALVELVRQDQDETWKRLGMKVAREVEAAAPGTYRFDCYTVED